jgi:hypothetical protein
METKGLWNRAIKHILGTRPAASGDHKGCHVLGRHEGPNVTVASDGAESIRLCLHHAKTWSESELCRDYAATGAANSFRVLSEWISYQRPAEASAPEFPVLDFEPRIAA